MTSVVAIVSGGLDSTVLAYYLRFKMGHEIISVTFDYNQRHCKELDYAAYHARRISAKHYVICAPLIDLTSALTSKGVEVPDLKDVLGHPQPITYVPFRNQVFLSIACQIAENEDASEVCFGAHTSDMYGYWDTTPNFIGAFNNLIQLNRLHKIVVSAPFAKLSKGSIVGIGHQLKVPFELTWSCYRGGEKHCGRCATCCERRQAFVEAAVPDPTVYEVKEA